MGEKPSAQAENIRAIRGQNPISARLKNIRVNSCNSWANPHQRKLKTFIIKKENMSLETIREEIAKLVTQYAQEAYKPKPFEAGKTIIPPSGKVIGEQELQNMVAASLDAWLTTGRFNAAF